MAAASMHPIFGLRQYSVFMPTSCAVKGVARKALWLFRFRGSNTKTKEDWFEIIECVPFCDMRDTGIARGGAINRRVSRLRTASSRRRQRPPVSSRKLWQLAQNCDANLACKTRCAMNRNPFEKWLNRVDYEFIISVEFGGPSEASRFGFSVDSVRLKATEIVP